MNTEGNTEGWRNNTENSALHHMNKLCFEMYSNAVALNCNNISQYIYIYIYIYIFFFFY